VAKAPDMDKKCVFCGTDGLHWKQAGEYSNWKLFDAEENIHECDVPIKRRYARERRNHEIMKDFGIQSDRAKTIDKISRCTRQTKRRQEEDVFASYAREER